MSWAAWDQLRAQAYHDDDITVNNLDRKFREELREVMALTPDENGKIRLVSYEFRKCADAGDGPEFARAPDDADEDEDEFEDQDGDEDEDGDEGGAPAGSVAQGAQPAKATNTRHRSLCGSTTGVAANS